MASTIILFMDSSTINPDSGGTKASLIMILLSQQIKHIPFALGFQIKNYDNPFDDFENIFNERIDEANSFYTDFKKILQ